MKVLIIGGGITGNALAFWLSKSSHDVTVVEKFSSLRDAGLQIDLRGFGVDVLKKMGLEDAFLSHAVAEQGWQVVDRSGRRRAYFPANKTGKGVQAFTSEYEIMRGDFVRMLYDANKEKVKYIFGTTVQSFREHDEHGVDVEFSDGNKDRFDLLVGADGQWSQTRTMMLGSDAPSAVHPVNDTHIAYFTMPSPANEGEPYLATIYVAPGQRSIMTRRHSANQLQVYIGCVVKSGPLKHARKGDVQAEKKAFTEIFQDAGWQTTAILKALNEATDFYCECVGLVKVEPWSKSRVVLVGDAAYCPTVNTGMGTTSSIVGAYVLAGEINERFDLAAIKQSGNNLTDMTDACLNASREQIIAALEAYDARFRSFMNQVQDGVLDDKGFMPSSSIGVGVFNLAAGAASLLRLNVAKWQIKEKIKDWQLPEYASMVKRV